MAISKSQSDKKAKTPKLKATEVVATKSSGTKPSKKKKPTTRSLNDRILSKSVTTKKAEGLTGKDTKNVDARRHGKRLFGTHDDPIKRKLVSLFESKASLIADLAAARGWSDSYYLDRILSGDDNVYDEYVSRLRDL